MARPPKDEAPTPVHVVANDTIGSGGLKTAVTIADGDDVTQGAKADAAVTNPALSASEIALLKGLLTLLTNVGTGAINIQGAIADGSAIAGKPVLIGGSDGTNVQHLIASTFGVMRAAISRGSDGVETTFTSESDAQGASVNSIAVKPFAIVFDGAQWVRTRAPVLFATVEATASGDTAIVTSSAAKKLRLLGYSIEVTSDAATTGGADIAIVLRDVTAAIGMGVTVFVPAAAGTVFGSGFETGWRNIGPLGKLMAVANTAFNVNLSAALTAGKVRVNIAYTEE